MNECLFCKIVSGEIPSTKVYEDEHCIAFNDIDPKAPTHILLIPKKHYAAIHEIPKDKGELFSHIMQAVQKIVTEKNLQTEGYRLVVNSGERAGQTVFHIHVHILSGRDMQWPPG